MIARSVGVSRTTVGEYLRPTAVIGITWPLPAGMDDAELERRLFTPAGFDTAMVRAAPSWTHVHTELRRRGVTLVESSSICVILRTALDFQCSDMI